MTWALEQCLIAHTILLTPTRIKKWFFFFSITYSNTSGTSSTAFACFHKASCTDTHSAAHHWTDRLCQSQPKADPAYASRSPILSRLTAWAALLKLCKQIRQCLSLADILRQWSDGDQSFQGQHGLVHHGITAPSLLTKQVSIDSKPAVFSSVCF